MVSYCQCSPIAVTNLKRTYLNKLKPGTEEGACLQKNNPPSSSIIISTLSTDYRAYRLREDSSVKKVALCIDSTTGSIFFSRDIVAQRTNLRGGGGFEQGVGSDRFKLKYTMQQLAEKWKGVPPITLSRLSPKMHNSECKTLLCLNNEPNCRLV